MSFLTSAKNPDKVPSCQLLEFWDIGRIGEQAKGKDDL
jgi:hypothetical protein